MALVRFRDEDARAGYLQAFGNNSGYVGSQALFSPLGAEAASATYAVADTGYTAYATPTDLITISGSATKTIVVLNFQIGAHSNAAALQTFYFLRRSTANTGGTSTNPTAVKYDSSQGAATAVVNVYTAAPTLGTTAGTLRINEISSTTATTAAGMTTLAGTSTNNNIVGMVDFRRPIILRGAAESLCLNYAGAALTAGFSAYYFIEWVEF